MSKVVMNAAFWRERAGEWRAVAHDTLIRRKSDCCSSWSPTTNALRSARRSANQIKAEMHFILGNGQQNSAPMEGNHRRTPNRNVKGLSLTSFSLATPCALGIIRRSPIPIPKVLRHEVPRGTNSSVFLRALSRDGCGEHVAATVH